MVFHHIPRINLIHTQLILRTWDSPQVVFASVAAMRIKGPFVQFTEHTLARLVLIENFPVLVVVQKIGPVQHGQSDWHRIIVPGRDIAVDETVRGVRRVSVRLLKSKFDQKLEKIFSLEGAFQMGAMQHPSTFRKHQQNEISVFVPHCYSKIW